MSRACNWIKASYELSRGLRAFYRKIIAGCMQDADSTARVLTSCVAVSTSLDIMAKVPIQQHGKT